MWRPIKEAAEHNLVSGIKLDITKLNTVLLTGAAYDENTQAKFQQT